MVKTDANPTGQFDLKIGLDLILSEIYHFDADNFIVIHRWRVSVTRATIEYIAFPTQCIIIK